MGKNEKPANGMRRMLLKSLAAGPVALGSLPAAAKPRKKSHKPAEPAIAARAEQDHPADAPPLMAGVAGSDYMVDVIKALGIEYVAANPGSAFRGLHESVVNHGGNQMPELLTCQHEETSVAMAVGYARAAGKPMAAFVHSTVGVQHAAMSIYHAFADRAPVLIFCGNTLDAATRRPFIEWLHSAQDNAAMVRDCLKWDDQPVSLGHFAESAVRAHRLASTAPMGPVMLAVDSELQEKPHLGELPPIPKVSEIHPPVGDAASLHLLARLLVGAQSPLILADRYARTEKAMPLLVELAELLGAAVVDLGGRFNFPTDHALNQTSRLRALAADADVILALEPIDLWGALNRIRDQIERKASPTAAAGAKICTLGVGEFLTHANYQDFQRYVGADLAITGDAEASLPALIEAVRRMQSRADRTVAESRAREHATQFAATRTRLQAAAKLGWNASPITTARLCADIWDVVRNEDWVLCGWTSAVSSWPERLWPMNRPYRQVSGAGAAGMGAGIGVAIGAALAHRRHGRVVVNIQTDGDLLYAPGALWTAAHHRIPLLTVMHNNRAYHQETMHVQRMANRHERGVDRALIGTTLTDPVIDFAKLAQSMGVWATGPVENPVDLRPALRKALDVVKRGEPALVDVVTQPR